MFASSSSLRATRDATIVGLVCITLYLVLERAIADHASPIAELRVLFQWDASNALGDAAYGGGWRTALLGLLMDIPVTICWAAGFVLLWDLLPSIRRAPLLAGLVYGALVMVVMTDLVVPIGHARQAPRELLVVLNILVAHTIFFGLPIALTVKHALRPRNG